MSRVFNLNEILTIDRLSLRENGLPVTTPCMAGGIGERCAAQKDMYVASKFPRWARYRRPMPPIGRETNPAFTDKILAGLLISASDRANIPRRVCYAD